MGTQKKPKYVSLNGIALRLIENNKYYNPITPGRYYRDAGDWSVGSKYIDGKLLSWSWRQGTPWLHRVELIPITKEEWEKDNKGYI